MASRALNEVKPRPQTVVAGWAIGDRLYIQEAAETVLEELQAAVTCSYRSQGRAGASRATLNPRVRLGKCDPSEENQRE
jgi:hypothetical protein